MSVEFKLKSAHASEQEARQLKQIVYSERANCLSLNEAINCLLAMHFCSTHSLVIVVILAAAASDLVVISFILSHVGH